MIPRRDSDAILATILAARAIGYLRADSTLTVREVVGARPDLPLGAKVGAPLLKVFPEFVGSEELLTPILAGREEQFALPMINRDGADGETCYFDLTVLAAGQTEPWPGGLVVVWEDVTAAGRIRQQAMQQRNELALLRHELADHNARLQGANHELRRMNQVKSRFVAVAAHELRSPLTVMIGYTNLLRDHDFGQLNERQRHFAGIIEDSAQRLLALLNNLLDVTRIDSGNLELNLQPLELAGLIQQTAVDFAPRLTAKAQCLHLVLPSEPVVALCDRSRVLQILDNLVGNANKFTPAQGAIHVRLSANHATGFAEVTVEDSGIGIAEEELEELFVSFYRASNAHESDGGGAGLGLNIVRSLVEQHGGEVHVRSALNCGATFTITLPLADPQAAAITSTAMRETPPAARN